MSFFAAVLILGHAATQAPQQVAVGDCRKRRIEIYQSFNPVMVLDGTADTEPDGDDLTLQFMIIKGSPGMLAKVTSDGQAIYLTIEELTDPKAGANARALLIAQAIDRQIELKYGIKCRPLEIGT